MVRYSRLRVLLGCVAASSVMLGCGLDAEHEDEVAAGETAAAPAAGGSPTSAAELKRMDDFVKNRIDRKSVRKTLRTSQGRKVDCLDINAQPALHGRPIAKPPVLTDAEPFAPKPGQVPALPEPLFTLDDGREDACAPGTVPVR